MSKHTGASTRRRAGGRTTAAELFTRPKRSIPAQLVTTVWHWRWELITAAAVYFIYCRLVLAGLTQLVAVLVMLTVLALVLAVPPTRRFLRTRCWCVLTRHRIRVCMRELRTLNYSGNAAFILFCKGTREGEAVWLWMRPGLSLDTLENRAEAIAAACWARDARITRSLKMAALVRVDVIRVDPLSASHIESPLLDATQHLPAGTVAPTRTLHVVRDSSITTPVDTRSPERVTTSPSPVTVTGKAPATATGPLLVPAVVSRNGEDVSDYV